MNWYKRAQVALDIKTGIIAALMTANDPFRLQEAYEQINIPFGTDPMTIEDAIQEAEMQYLTAIGRSGLTEPEEQILNSLRSSLSAGGEMQAEEPQIGQTDETMAVV
jgi:cell division protein ZapA (FtsZ GTPase activity inhibitor)